MLKSSDFQVQARMAQSVDDNGELIQATQFTAVAMKGNDSDRIHVEINNNRTGNVLVMQCK